MPKTPKQDVEDDPMFDTSDEAINRAHNRRLALLCERIENLREEKKGIADDERDVFAEAKAVGYDTKMVRELLKLRKMSADDRAEYDSILAVYRDEVGI